MATNEPFLSRWSKRKSEARTEAKPAEEVPATLAPDASVPATETPAAPEPLPPVESLTPESDFTGFMRPEVDEGLRRKALKTLFQDPRFNVMDGLDVYIDDYSKPDPLPEGWLEKLNQMKHLGAYEEEVPIEPGEAKGSGIPLPGEPVEAGELVEKPPDEQGLAPPPSSDTSDTEDAGISPPPMPE